LSYIKDTLTAVSKGPDPDHKDPETERAQIKCPVIVSNQVCIQADVKIDPKVTVGDIKTICSEPRIGKCSQVGCSRDRCEFSIVETIFVKIPLNFSVEAQVDPAGHICGTPEVEPCPRCDKT
jgi:hypothetical protein